MRLRIVVSVLAFLTICGGAAYAQETPKVDIFAGYSYVRENPSTSGASSFSLNGGSASATYHVRDWVSAVADFGGYHNGNILGSGVDGTLSTYLFGPRVSYRSYRHFTPFAEALFGVKSNKQLRRAAIEEWLVELGQRLDVGPQVLEDALCNWQKSPEVFVRYRG